MTFEVKPRVKAVGRHGAAHTMSCGSAGSPGQRRWLPAGKMTVPEAALSEGRIRKVRNPAGRASRRRVVLLAGIGVCVLLGFSGSLSAQELTLNLGEGGEASTRILHLLALVTVLSLVPGLAVTITCFPFIVTVLSILRQALGLQAAPPNMLIVTLALFLSWYVMDPVLTEAWSAGGSAFAEGTLPLEEALPRAMEPFRHFMAARLNPDTFSALEALRPETASAGDPARADLSLLIPSFLLSEITRAFQIGFILFLPFLIIDLVVAAILMSMGMMMVPPALVALPFKLAFFVVSDGWGLVASALVRSYG